MASLTPHTEESFFLFKQLGEIAAMNGFIIFTTDRALTEEFDFPVTRLVRRRGNETREVYVVHHENYAAFISLADDETIHLTHENPPKARSLNFLTSATLPLGIFKKVDEATARKSTEYYHQPKHSFWYVLTEE